MEVSGQLLASPHYPQGNNPWVGLRTGLEAVESLAPAGTQTPAVQPVARRYTDWAIPTHWVYINPLKPCGYYRPMNHPL
jgi:hypothetical protein